MNLLLDGVYKKYETEKKTSRTTQRKRIIPQQGALITADSFFEEKLRLDAARRCTDFVVHEPPEELNLSVEEYEE